MCITFPCRGGEIGRVIPLVSAFESMKIGQQAIAEHVSTLPPEKHIDGKDAA
jgi:hypothetical protein